MFAYFCAGIQKGITQDKPGHVHNFTHDLVIISEALPRLPRVNSSMRVSSGHDSLIFCSFP